MNILGLKKKNNLKKFLKFQLKFLIRKKLTKKMKLNMHKMYLAQHDPTSPWPILPDELVVDLEICVDDDEEDFLQFLTFFLQIFSFGSQIFFSLVFSQFLFLSLLDFWEIFTSSQFWIFSEFLTFSDFLTFLQFLDFPQFFTIPSKFSPMQTWTWQSRLSWGSHWTWHSWKFRRFSGIQKLLRLWRDSFKSVSSDEIETRSENGIDEVVM